MRRLEPHVNLVPVIAKADTMTLAERDAFRRLVLSELKANGVNLFPLGDSHTGAPPTPPAPKPPGGAAKGGGANAPPSAMAPSPPLQARAIATTQPPPFAVCASEDGTRVYPWGTCMVEDPTHSDLSILRSMLFASSMLAAKRRTLELYETSYAEPRRASESARAAREARALDRERLVARAVSMLGATTAVALAATGALHVLRPEWAASLTAVLDGVMQQPAETARAALQTLTSLVVVGAARLSGPFRRLSELGLHTRLASRLTSAPKAAAA